MNTQILEYGRFAVAGLGTTATYFFGGWDTVLQVLVAFVVMDYATGVLAAYVTQKLNSDIGRRGIAKKVGIFVVVAVAHLVDGATGMEEPILRTLTLWFYISNEGLSSLENLVLAGVRVPGPLKDALERLSDKKAG